MCAISISFSAKTGVRVRGRGSIQGTTAAYVWIKPLLPRDISPRSPLMNLAIVQLALEKLTGGVTWSFFEEDHFPRHLVAGQMVTDIGFDRVLINGGVLQDATKRRQCPRSIAVDPPGIAWSSR